MRAPATAGMRLEEVDTPALVLDLDAFERNLRRMSDAVAGRRIRVRTHSKTHKCPEIARRQVAAGAFGVCCQKVSEAEALVEGGIADVVGEADSGLDDRLPTVQCLPKQVAALGLLRAQALAGTLRLVGIVMDDGVPQVERDGFDAAAQVPPPRPAGPAAQPSGGAGGGQPAPTPNY